MASLDDRFWLKLRPVLLRLLPSLSAFFSFIFSFEQQQQQPQQRWIISENFPVLLSAG